MAHATKLDGNRDIAWAARGSPDLRLLQIAVGVECSQHEGAFSIFDRCHFEFILSGMT